MIVKLLPKSRTLVIDYITMPYAPIASQLFYCTIQKTNMRQTLLQLSSPYLLAFFALATLLGGCSSLSDADVTRLRNVVEQGQTVAGTAAANAPSYLATSQAYAATAVVVAPTVVVDAKSAAETIASHAPAVATTASQSGVAISAVAQQLQTRLSTMLPDEQGYMRFAVSEAEISALLLSQSAADENARFENLNISFGDGGILMSGELTSPVQVPFAITFVPYVDDGKLQLSIREARVGVIEVPNLVLDLALGRLNRTMGYLIAFVPGDVEVVAVDIVNGEMVVVAHRAP